MKIMRKILSYMLMAALVLTPVSAPQEASANAFTDIFGGSPVSPADVAYAAYSFGSDLTLVWPQFSAGNPNVAARFMNMTATASNLNVVMPNATLNSVGYDAIIYNAGSNSFNVVTNTNNAIVTIPPGVGYYVILNNNSTISGTWQTVQFGAGTSSANASALAGNGLMAIAGLLNVNFNANIVSNNFNIIPSSRAQLYVWTGGAGTITLPTAASVGSGFVWALANNGSGSVSVATSGGDQIDGASSSTFSQTQSGFIMSTGSSWATVGKGIQNTFAITLLNLNVAGSSDVTETSAQAQNVIQQYTGTLTGNINVIVPNTVQLYVANNLTSGAFTLTVKTAAGTGISVVQGSTAILYCDGTNIVNAFTASVSGTLSLVAGSAPSPSLSFQSNPGTGIYLPAANTIGLAANTYEVLQAISAATSVNFLQVGATGTGTAPTISALGSDTNIGLNLVPKGTGKVQIGGTNISLGGALTTAGAFTTAGANPLTLTTTGSTNITLPTSGTLLSSVNNLSDLANAGTARTNLGLGTAATQPTSAFLQPANNLSDVSSQTTALANILGSTPALPTGTTGVTQTAGNSSTRLATTAFVNGTALSLTNGTTATTQAVADSTTKVATTAFVNPASSLTTNGYTKFPNGLFLEWGTTATINAGTSASTNFPIAFPTACFNVSITPQNPGSSGGASAAVTLISASAFTLANNINVSQQFYYMAVGN